jgi:hypothetical protein
MVFSLTFIAFLIVLVTSTLAIVFRKRKIRVVGLIQGVALQMAVVVPVAVAQLTGFVWKNWSIDPTEAIEVFPLSILLDMAGWSVYETFEWLVPNRQTWLFSNLPEYTSLWFVKVMVVAMLLAWRREHKTRTFDWLTILILLLVLADSWASRDFSWWGT